MLLDLDGRVRVLDFGLVSRIDRADAISQDGMVVGTLAYLSPEQLAGEAATPASDLYALGCVLFQLLTGTLPFAGGVAAAIAAKLAPPPRVDQHVDGVAPALVDVVHRLMAIDAPARPALAEIRAVLGLPAGAPRSDRVAPSGERFVGRAAELARLAACLDTARDGRAQLVLVAGDSGIGKTALADEVMRRAGALGFVGFRGRCYEREQVPFVAFDRVVDAVTVALQRWPRERLAPLQPTLRALARIFPALGLLADDACAVTATADGAAPAGDPRAERRRAFDAFVRLCAHWQAEGPLLLVLDDLQWADDESLALLDALLRAGAGRMAILALARRVGQGDGHPLDALVGRMGAGAVEVTALALAPMPLDEAVAIVDSVGGGALDRGTARALADHAGGNPFLVRRLAEHLAGLDAGARAAVLDASGSSDDVLRAMIGTLSPRAEQVLALAAAAGGDVPGSLLRDASGLAGADFDLAAGELIAARFLKTVPAGPAFSGRARGTVDDAPRVDLYHDRIREVVYRGLDEERRRALHRGLALTLQASPSEDGHDAEALARHWGAAGDRAQRRRFALEAAELAAGKLAFRRAAELLRLAQGDIDPGETALAIARRWERIGELHELGGDLGSAAAAYREALAAWYALPDGGTGGATADERRRARLRLQARAGCCTMATGDLATGRALFAAGLASLGLPLDRSLPARGLTLLTLMIRERLTGAGERRRAAAPDPWLATRVRFFDLMMRAFQPLWPLPAAEAAFRCAVLGRGAAEHEARINALAFTAAAPAARIRCSPKALARSNRLLDAAEEVARAHAVPLGLEIVQINRALLWLAVEPARARRTSEAALAGLGRLGMGDSYEGNRARAQHMIILWMVGDHDELLAAAGREVATRDNNMMTVAIAHLGSTLVHSYRGDVAAATRSYDALAARVPEAPVSAMRMLVNQAAMAVQIARGAFADAVALAADGERVARASGGWLVGLTRGSWTVTALEAALGAARQRRLPADARARALGWARWLADDGLFDNRCLGDRALALFADAAGDRKTARRHLARALERSSAATRPYARWLVLEAARDLGALNHDLDGEASDLTLRERFVHPPGWRTLALEASRS